MQSFNLSEAESDAIFDTTIKPLWFRLGLIERLAFMNISPDSITFDTYMYVDIQGSIKVIEHAPRDYPPLDQFYFFGGHVCVSNGTDSVLMLKRDLTAFYECDGMTYTPAELRQTSRALYNNFVMATRRPLSDSDITLIRLALAQSRFAVKVIESYKGKASRYYKASLDGFHRSRLDVDSFVNGTAKTAFIDLGLSLNQIRGTLGSAATILEG